MKYSEKDNTEILDPSHVSYLCVEVLPELKGWYVYDDVVKSMLTTVRPSRIRIVGPNEGVKMDALSWRVTIYVDDANNIEKIEQEVAAGLFGKITNGYHLDCLRNHGIWDEESGQWLVSEEDEAPV